MPDDVVDGGSADPGDGSGGGGDGEGTSLVTTTADLEAVADEFDAEALASLSEGGDDAGKGEGEGKKGAAKPTAASLDPVDEFIEKNYQGDRAAFVAGLHETRKEMRRLADEHALLKQKLEAQPRDASAEFKAHRDQDPDVLALDQEITGYVADTKAISTRQLEIAQEAGSLDREVHKAEGELLHAPEEQKAKIYSNLVQMRAQLSALQSEYTVNDHRLKSNDRDYRNAQRSLRRLESEIRQQLADRESSSERDKRDAVATRAQFTSSFDAQAELYGLEPGSTRYNYLKESTRTQLADYLDSLGDDADGIDISLAVGKIMVAAAKAFGLQPKAQRPGAPRPKPRPILQPGARPNGSGNPPQKTPSRDDVLSDADRVRARADRIFSAIGKQQAGGRGSA